MLEVVDLKAPSTELDVDRVRVAWDRQERQPVWLLVEVHALACGYAQRSRYALAREVDPILRPPEVHPALHNLVDHCLLRRGKAAGDGILLCIRPIAFSQVPRQEPNFGVDRLTADLFGERDLEGCHES